MSFQEVQAAFVAHIKDPENTVKPSDIEDRRMKIYRELFFNNVEGFVASAFPVLKSLYDEKHWIALVRQFFAEHECTSPYFLEISQEFLKYLDQGYRPNESDPVFMFELAHYEWVELNVSILQRDKYDLLFDAELDENQPLFLSSVAQCVQYRFPVHQIQVDYQPEQPQEGPYSFVVYRDLEEEIQFIALNPMTSLLLASVEQQPGMSVLEICEQIAQQTAGFTAAQLAVGALQTLQQFAEKGIVVDKSSRSPLLMS
ncbi:putative DNA-binding domain-containing protein [Pseudoalteromonas luteoviolacea]|uniref:HvfC family RiPP maturation protein n=1 Tax=Pseudoalteromonas luteoviolacea TaxID=43657 RepID=UPI001F43E2E5|nr:putative DNA-binding domain-containing protein [Pseudoalteromonas luteoviolacea]MCF6442071.1 putative DNA-binding domain-containing protein [Pseudoalteromonas luteoviolacea]